MSPTTPTDSAEQAGNSAFCILPWIHLCTTPRGEALPCCIGDWRHPLGDTRAADLAAIWNGSGYAGLRRRMLEGKPSPHCSACYDDEAVGTRSMRMVVNELFRDDFDAVGAMDSQGRMGVPDWRTLDVRPSNICNFKCRTCNSSFSSAWEEEDRRWAGGSPPRVTRRPPGIPLVEQLAPVLPRVKAINFAGGEPLITAEHYEILERLIACGNTTVQLRYSTNASVLRFKDHDLEELWRHFPNVTLVASIDAAGARGEYLRSGLDWARQLDNLHRIQAIRPPVALRFSTVISIFNVLTLTEMLEALAAESMIALAGAPLTSFYRLKDPAEFSVQVLDPESKREAAQRIEDWIGRHPEIAIELCTALRDVVGAMQPDMGHLRPAARARIDSIDARRGESLTRTFPELTRFYGLSVAP